MEWMPAINIISLHTPLFNQKEKGPLKSRPLSLSKQKTFTIFEV
jgi:hypothetical protein